MTALDRLNARYGRGTLHVASTGATVIQRDWEMKQERRTPNYTTVWAEMPTVRA